MITDRVLQPWFDGKTSLQERNGFSFGLDYIGLYLGGNNSEGEDDASGGIFRFFVSWDLIGRGTPHSGTLVWKVEHGHRYGPASDSVSSMAFGITRA